jgi:hypothetical protein
MIDHYSKTSEKEIRRETHVGKVVNEGGDPDSFAKRVVESFNRWLSRANALTKNEHAAALIAADLIFNTLQEHLICLREEDTIIWPWLRSLGVDGSFRDGFSYAHSWLRRAAVLDSTCDMSKLARVMLMRLGFETLWCNGGTGEPDECCRKVINEGENILSSSNIQDYISTIHFMVGDAYRDMIYSACLIMNNSDDSSSYKLRVIEYRKKAIEHYKSGLLIDKYSYESRQAYIELWRLIVGVEPNITRFYYEGD